MANSSNSNAKQSKKNKSKSSKKPSPPELITRVHFTAFELLKSKTRDKLRSIRSLSVVMLPKIATERSFQELQFVKVSTVNKSAPALLVLDSSIDHNATVVSENEVPDLGFNKDQDITITSPCPRLIAEEVSLLILSHSDISEFPSFTQYLKQQLIQSNFVIQLGEHIIFQYLTQSVILKVHSVKNFASDLLDTHVPSQCIWQTKVIFESSSSSGTNQIPRHRIMFDDIGGYRSEIKNLKREIGQFLSPEKSTVKMAKGILISGPSGCGKSLIGKALRNEYKDKCVNINLDLAKSKFQGEAEMVLRQQFLKAAKRSPCLVFIDDLDLLCTNRDRGGDNTGIVTTLLHLIDGLNTTANGILVIAAATKPQTLDAALRRPGRISHDIILSPPEESDRGAILQKMINRVPHNISTVELENIASTTPGYVGGDLHNVMLEAVMHSEGGDLTREDLEVAVAAVKPVALRDAANVDSKISISDICGYDTAKTKLLESLNLSLNYGHVFEHCGLSAPTQFLIFGPPGCGKSSLIMALAAEFHLSVIRIKRSTVLGKYFGESEQNLAKLFTQALESSPCVLHFENFEGLAGRSKGDDGGSDVEGRIINHLKVQLDGIVRNDGVFIFAETNRPDLLDKDVIRPGRFHEYSLINLPDADDRAKILQNHLLPASFSDDLSLEFLIQETDGFTVSEIIQLCNEIKQQGPKGEMPLLNLAGVEEALELVSPGTSKKMLQRQVKFASIYCSNN